MDQARERQLLQEYETELETTQRDVHAAQHDFDVARQRLDESQRRTEALTSVVNGLRLLLAGTDGEHEQQTTEPVEAPAEQPARPKRKGAGPGLKSILYQRLQERRHLSVDEARQYLQTLPTYEGSMPSRTTIVARLGDLTREGRAVSDGQGKYSISENGASVEGRLAIPTMEVRPER